MSNKNPPLKGGVLFMVGAVGLASPLRRLSAKLIGILPSAGASLSNLLLVGSRIHHTYQQKKPLIKRDFFVGGG